MRRGIALVAASGIGATAIGAAFQPGATPAPAPSRVTPTPPAPAVLAQPEKLDSPAPSAADALRVFSDLEEYLVAGTPENAAPGGPQWRSVAGVCLTVLLDGRVLARATAMEDRGSALVPDAAARGRVGARVAQGLWADLRTKFPPAVGAESPEARRILLSSLVVSVELAGEPTPLMINDYAEANLEVAPGLEGVGANAPSKGSDWMFPLQQLALGTLPSDALGSTVSRATDSAALSVLPPVKLRADHAVALFKFPVVHAVRTSPGGTPSLLFRGHEPIDASRMKYSELMAAAERLATHLRWRLNTPKHAELGVYSPIAASSAPANDESLAVGLTLTALFEHAAVSGGDTTALVARWRDSLAGLKSMSLVGRAATVIAGERAAALTTDSAASADLRAKVVEVAGGLAIAFEPKEGFHDSIPPAGRGLVACAMVRAARVAGDRTEMLDRAGAAVERALLDAPQGELVSQMPWLGWAAQDLAELRGQKELPSAPALRTLRDRVWDHQLTAADAGGDGLDLIGGVVFTKSRAMLPSAATARPVAFFAGALADERLTTPQERPVQLARVIQALRFLRQLQADESSAWMYPDRKAALGGVRAAPWDHKMAADASVYTLLAYARTIGAINAQVMAPRPASEPQTPAKER